MLTTTQPCSLIYQFQLILVDRQGIPHIIYVNMENCKVEFQLVVFHCLSQIPSDQGPMALQMLKMITKPH